MIAILLLDLKLINVLISPSFPNSLHLCANFPNNKGPDPRYKWIEKSLTCIKHVGFKALCTKQVGFKALVISKSFISLLIGCVRLPTPRTDKGSSSIIDNMITLNGIPVYNILNFKLCLVLWWPPFKIVSGNPDIHPTWPPLLRTEKVDEILIVFLLNYWANHGFKFW
jgi:hypothetical protein